jgi:hypothetical protein
MICAYEADNSFLVVEVKAKLRPTVAYFNRQFLRRVSYINVSLYLSYGSSNT